MLKDYCNNPSGVCGWPGPGSNGSGDEKWFNSEYTFKIEPNDLLTDLDFVSGRNRGTKRWTKYIQVKMRVKEMKKASIHDSREKFTEKGRKELMQ